MMTNPENCWFGKYNVGRIVGEGAFGKVYVAVNIDTQQRVAIKVMEKDKLIKDGMAEQTKREIRIMALVRNHPNIVNLIEVLATKSKIYIVMDYVKGGDLFERVKKGGKLKEDLALKYFRQIVMAIDFCHSRGIYHRDLKLENVLLDANDNVKISDFGLSALGKTKDPNQLLYTPCGTPEYVAPEILKRKGYYGCKSDIWSLGVLLFAILAGYLPFQNDNLMELYRQIQAAEYTCPEWFSKDVASLINRMLDPDENSRMTMQDIKETYWFKQGLVSTSTYQQPDNDGISGEEEASKIYEINAFDIICLTSEFDSDKEARFISQKPASLIISKLKALARELKMNMQKKSGGLFKLEGREEGVKGILAIDATVFALVPELHLVEIKKRGGDSFEYRKILCESIRPGLQDIIHSWPGEPHCQSSNSKSQSLVIDCTPSLAFT